MEHIHTEIIALVCDDTQVLYSDKWPHLTVTLTVSMEKNPFVQENAPFPNPPNAHIPTYSAHHFRWDEHYTARDSCSFLLKGKRVQHILKGQRRRKKFCLEGFNLSVCFMKDHTNILRYVNIIEQSETNEMMNSV